MIADIIKLLHEWDNILIISHASPDGDTLGSAAALMRGLIGIGKNVSFGCSDSIDAKYRYLFDGLPNREFEPDKVVTVDIADTNLMGTLKEPYKDRVDLAIDHHASHRPFGKIEWVEAGSASNAEMIYQLLHEMKIKIDKFMADAIYTGISTDTGCFRYQNVTASTHRVAADVIELGADAGNINRRMFETRSRAQNEAEVMALGAIEFYEDDKCAMLVVTREMMDRIGIRDSELDALVSIPRQIEGVLIGITLKERECGAFKVSVRTNEPANASEICAKLGGGGHKAAAGCSVKGDLETVKQKLLSVCKKHIEDHAL